MAASGAAVIGQIDLVRQLAANRDRLRGEFAEIWPVISKHPEVLTERWAATTLGFSQVNAGPACIAAFWRVTAAVPARCLPAALAGGEAAIDICRFAGTRAAQACLDALPDVMRLTRAEATQLAAWWRGLARLAREAPTVVEAVILKSHYLLAGGDGVAFSDFVSTGLKATAKDMARRAAFFALDDPLAKALLARRGGAEGFADAERMLSAFIAGLWGVEARLKAADPAPAGSPQRTMIASGTVMLPPVFSGAPQTGIRALYRAAAAHAQAHLMTPGTPQPIGTLKPLQVALIGLVEDARIEALSIRRFPGLRRLWEGFHTAQPAGPRTAINLMARLSRALLDPGYADDDGFVLKGRALLAAAQLEDAGISRRIGGLLGNDLGQMRLAFNAKTYAVEPAYRDDNMHLWTLPDVPDDAMSMTVDTARGTAADDAGEQQPGDGAPAPQAREAGREERATLLATYPEWDAAAGVERPDWTSLRDTIPLLGRANTAATDDAVMRARIARLVHRSMVGQSMRRKREADGDQLAIDAAIAAAIAQRGGQQPDERVYRDRRPRGRDLATLIILDVSQSTAVPDASGQSVLVAERRAVTALAMALESRGDHYALRAFASAGRDDVRLTRLKDFDEPFSATVGARIAGLASGLSTRLGAALRHAGAELAPLRTTRKLVLVLTDGEPSDIDVADPGELVEDAKRAVSGLRRRGIDVFRIVMDPQGAGSGAAIFGHHNAIAVRRLDELPARLAGVYFRLTQR